MSDESEQDRRLRKRCESELLNSGRPFGAQEIQERMQSHERGESMADFTTLPECARRAGLEYRTLHSWVRRGLVIPSHPSEGTGHPTYFSSREVEVVGMLARMRAAGLGMDILTGAARTAKHHPERDVIELASGDGVTVIAHVLPPTRKAIG